MFAKESRTNAIRLILQWECGSVVGHDIAYSGEASVICAAPTDIHEFIVPVLFQSACNTWSRLLGVIQQQMNSILKRGRDRES